MSTRYIKNVDQLFNIAEEPATAYKAAGTTPSTDGFIINQLINEGVLWEFFEDLEKRAPLTEAEWAEILDVSEKSIQRYRKKRERFRRSHSEKIIKMAELIWYANDFFESKEMFGKWLRTESIALGGKAPVHFLTSSYGIDIIIAELVRMEHGIFA